jgi:hypothetical protein
MMTQSYELNYLLSEISQCEDFIHAFGSPTQREQAHLLCLQEFQSRYAYRRGEISFNELAQSKRDCLCGIKVLILEAMELSLNE